METKETPGSLYLYNLKNNARDVTLHVGPLVCDCNGNVIWYCAGSSCDPPLFYTKMAQLDTTTLFTGREVA